MNIENKLAKRINVAKHENPPAVFSALNIATGWLGCDVSVVRYAGKYYAGVAASEFCCVLGSTEREAKNALSELGI